METLQRELEGTAPSDSDTIKFLKEQLQHQRNEAFEAKKLQISAQTDLETIRYKKELLAQEIQKLTEKLHKKQDVQVFDLNLLQSIDLAGQIEQLKGLQQQKSQLNKQMQDIWKDIIWQKQEFDKRIENIENKESFQSQQSPRSENYDVKIQQALHYKNELFQQLVNLRQEADNLKQIIHEKDDTLQILQKNVQELRNENSSLTNTLQMQYHQGPADPPPDQLSELNGQYQDSQINQNLISDIGSTGSVFNKLQEEQKEHQLSSPNPSDYFYPQQEKEPAFPPQEGSSDNLRMPPPPQEYWERPVTPRRDNQVSAPSSGSSTPHRTDFEISSPAPQSFQRFTNQLQDEDFFDMMTQEESKKSFEPIPHSLFD